MANQTQDLQVIAEGHIKAIEDQILKLQEIGELDLPQDYSASNALRSAYLILQETTDMSNKPALDVCSKTSIANALMSMVTQGLNPAKNQGYFIVYAGKLTFQRSYFGSEALAKRVDLSIADIVAEPVYAGDTVEYSIVHGKKVIARHLQTLDSVDAGKIKAAYAMTINHAGEITRTIMMTFEEIKAAWKQSKTKPFDDKDELKKSSAHAKFTGEMARRTVINRLCKDIINSSSDKNLLKKAIDQADQENAEMIIDAEIEANANKTFVDIEGKIVDAEFEPGQEKPQQEQPDIDALFHKTFLWHKGKVTVEKITQGIVLLTKDLNTTEEEIKKRALEEPNSFLQEVTRILTPKPSPESSEKSESEKSTEVPIEEKETPESQENQNSEKHGEEPDPFGEENPIDTAMRTGKEEKEQKQNEPKASPKWVAELNKWLDEVKPEMRHARMEKIKSDSFPKLCEADQDKIVLHYNELQGESQNESQAAEQPGREF